MVRQRSAGEGDRVPQRSRTGDERGLRAADQDGGEDDDLEEPHPMCEAAGDGLRASLGLERGFYSFNSGVRAAHARSPALDFAPNLNDMILKVCPLTFSLMHKGTLKCTNIVL